MHSSNRKHWRVHRWARVVSLSPMQAPRFVTARRHADVGDPSHVRFAREDGKDLGWRVERWLGHAATEELNALSRVVAPVLDIGCGPGRHVLALARRGVMALGVDISSYAVGLAQARGAPVLHRSVFEPVPGAGRWGSALLLDGNIGIGGEPTVLLQRVSELVTPKGRCLVEVEGPGTRSERISVRVESPSGNTHWFPWAVVAANDLEQIGRNAGFSLEELWHAGDRWFGCLVSI